MIPLKESLRPTKNKRPESVMLYLAEEEPKRKEGFRSYVSVAEVVAEFSEFPEPTLEELGWYRKSVYALRKLGLVNHPRIQKDPHGI